MSSSQEVGQIFGEGTGPATALLRSPTVFIAAIGLWGVNIWIFQSWGIDYKHVLLLDIVGSAGEEMSDEGDEVDEEEVEDGNSSLVASIGSGLKKESGKKTSDGSTGVVRTAAGIAAGVDQSASSDSLSSMLSNKSTGVTFDNDRSITSTKLMSFSIFLFVLLQITEFVWLNLLQSDTIGAIFAFYGFAGMAIALPFKSTRWIRLSTGIVLKRIWDLIVPRCYCLRGSNLSNIIKPVPFLDVFFADAMCSMSKVFFDLAMLWHLASHYPEAVPSSVHSIIIPSFFASIPYLIRARQCIVMHTVGKFANDPKRSQHILNAIKYSTSLFPICLSAYQKTLSSSEDADMLEKVLIVLLIVNSFYSFAWDVIMDWGMLENPTSVIEEHCMSKSDLIGRPQVGCEKGCLRSKLRFGPAISAVIIVIDGILRFTWILRFYENELFVGKDEFILCTALVEVVRRAIWNVLRVEWELIKQKKKAGNARINQFNDEIDSLTKANGMSNGGGIALVPVRRSTSRGSLSSSRGGSLSGSRSSL
eukprot:CAMPEP_0194371904 /NCGR_PEP_ID=MMETSP0174-20130528/20253_1 /TAXON_ID=216777 /ORGANISM="Proboscia alata, Strain PI-D3" /LENGTH=531 /DNA_ID=CAMNT_0039150149 /DNA_START=199 /DNA_END=1794 /DNA_ORIENTATION=+